MSVASDHPTPEMHSEEPTQDAPNSRSSESDVNYPPELSKDTFFPPKEEQSVESLIDSFGVSPNTTSELPLPLINGSDSIPKLSELSADPLDEPENTISPKESPESEPDDTASEDGLPMFQFSELTLGALVGTGSYCTVHAIRGVTLTPSTAATPISSHQERLRQRFASQCPLTPRFAPLTTRTSEVPGNTAPKCVLKRLRTNLTSVNQTLGRADLVSELQLLRYLSRDAIRHAGIIGLHGHSHHTDTDTNTEEVDTFLVLDRMSCTLKNKLYKWRQIRGIGLMEALDLNTTQSHELWLERLLVITRIASALHHLHQHSVLFRDLKPENVGFDEYQHPKLFDFGLSKRIDGLASNSDGLYQLTAMTGSILYMAPEVSTGKPYNYSVDVYSLSILAHELLSLKRPFVPLKFGTEIVEAVVRGVRPPLVKGWPVVLKWLLGRMWGDLEKRPDMREVVQVLEGMLRGSDEKLFPVSTRRLWFK